MAETPEELRVPADQAESAGDASAPAAVPEAVKTHRLADAKAAFVRMLKPALILLEKFGLYLFMLVLPLVLTGYPAYLIVTSLLQTAKHVQVEAALTNIDITKVADGETGVFPFKSKGRTDVTLYFKGADGRVYHTVIERPWVSPGLRKQMEERYGDRESFTLYLERDGRVSLDEQVASERMIHLSMLMALVLFASMLAIFIRHRLADRMPSLVTHESAANARSIIYSQLIALMVAFVFTFVIHYTPVVVSHALFLGLYWGAALLLGISLRLLVFQNPPPPPVVEENPRDRGLR